MKKRNRGLSLMEVCLAVTLMAVFSSVFLSFSLSLRRAQTQQSTRNLAFSLLDAEIRQLREQGPGQWEGPWQHEVTENQTSFRIHIEPTVLPGASPESLGGLIGTISWKGPTGPQMMRREVWCHERLQ